VPQLRQNIITGDWVVIAPERAKRPNDFITAPAVRQQSKIDCVFCVGKPAWQERFKEYDTKHIYITPNKYPAFLLDGTTVSTRSFKVEEGFYRARSSMGGHDVVVIVDHDQDLPKFTQDIWVELLQVFRKRYLDLAQKHKVEYTMPIYNHRPQSGASIEHPHAQIFASSIVPNLVAKELSHTQHHFESEGRCAFCDLIAHEKKEKIRVLVENEDFISFTFFAARFPFEIWLLPKKHQSRYEDQKDLQLKSLAEILHQTLHLLDKTLNDPPLNLFFHTLPNSIEASDSYHWHIEIAPRLANYGGFELGSGVIIDVVSPEKAAEYLRGKNGK